ncbi:MAG: hypothetical protein DI536_16600 [Archangium gephyra]|uniref:TfoX N-terminal domain-containing protein n=1 Tax=Archangium gephyra TaxID=48 RepID=A0A2W5TKY6_9BACT|nr:MAG: hypothetical protein DI536_16600 [Archangium gephyra]
MSTLNAHLKDLIAELSAELPEVSEKRMFGSDAFFANEIIYCIVWDGRVVLKFRDETKFAQARALEGAANFDPMQRGDTMTSWAVMPEDLVDSPDELRPWVEFAHRDAMTAPKKKKKKPAKTAKPSPAGTKKRRAQR